LKIHPEVVRKDSKARLGRGFSREELKEAGVDFKQALRLTIPVDLRRKTKHEENVSVLRQHLGLRVPKISKPPKPAKEPSRKPSRPTKVEVAEQKPAKPITKKAKEVSKPLKHAKASKAVKTEKPAPKKSATKRKAEKSKSTEED